MRRRCMGLIGLFSLSLFSGFAQAPSDTDRHVVLDVVVTDKSGKPVAGLQQQDFTLLDNKQPRKLTRLGSPRGDAVQGVQLHPIRRWKLFCWSMKSIPTSRTFRLRERRSKNFYVSMAANFRARLHWLFLSDSGIALGNLTTQDGNALATGIKQNRAGLRSITRSQGMYGANDRVGLSLNSLQELANYEAPRPGRKLVIWISPGWPLLSGPNIILSDKDQQRLFSQIVGISDSLRRARITLYSIDPLGTQDTGGFRTSYYEEFTKGVKKAHQVQIGDLGLQVIATQSGGRVLISNNDVTGQIASVVGDANAFYVLTFDAPAGDGPNEYHALEIKLDKSGLKALTRTGYYAQPAR